VSRLCRHLLGESAEDLDKVWLLSGAGLDHDVFCAACADSAGPIELIVAYEGCVGRADVESEVTAIRGEPGIAERIEPVDANLVRTGLPVAPLDIAPVPDRAGDWLLLTQTRVLHWHADTAQTVRERQLRAPAFDADERPWNNRQPRPRICAAAGGRFAAVVVDYGRRGLVLDLERGGVTMRLDRERYHPETTPYPIAFRCGARRAGADTCVGLEPAGSVRPGNRCAAHATLHRGAARPAPTGALSGLLPWPLVLLAGWSVGRR
jgi:hypothetical protein